MLPQGSQASFLAMRENSRIGPHLELRRGSWGSSGVVVGNLELYLHCDGELGDPLELP